LALAHLLLLPLFAVLFVLEFHISAKLAVPNFPLLLSLPARFVLALAETPLHFNEA